MAPKLRRLSQGNILILIQLFYDTDKVSGTEAVMSLVTFRLYYLSQVFMKAPTPYTHIKIKTKDKWMTNKR